jgi:hypothetical protein
VNIPGVLGPKDQNRPTYEEEWNGPGMAVSPFDGLNRIRFKGSLDFRFLIFD